MQIKDSGERATFDTGAVRDISKGKGRTDLLPLSVISKLMKDDVLTLINYYQKSNEVKFLYEVLERTMGEFKPYLVLELSKHFEKGAEKYEVDNWKKGIPQNRYIDSAIRHYLKHLDLQEDEDHLIAFIWNVTCLIWTIENAEKLESLTGHLDNLASKVYCQRNKDETDEITRVVGKQGEYKRVVRGGTDKNDSR